MKLKVKIFLLLILFVSVFSVSLYAKSGEINSIDYNIVIKKDGKVAITEVWDVYLNKSDFSKVFQDGEIVSNIVIKEYNKDGSTKQVYEQVDNEENLKTYKYIYKDNELIIKSGASKEKRFLHISYELEQCVFVYLDCAELNLVLQNDKFPFESKEITGKVSFENDVKSFSQFNTWIHSDGISNVTKVEETGKINFYVEDNDQKEKLDIKVVFPVNVIDVDEYSIINGNRWEIIYEEELYNKTLKDRETKVEFMVHVVVFILGVALVIATIVLFIIICVKKYREKDNETEEEINDKINDKTLAKNKKINQQDK